MKPRASLYPFAAQPIPLPTPGPPPPLTWVQHPQPVLNPTLPPGTILVLPALPRTLLVTGDGGPVTSGPGAARAIVPLANPGSSAQPLQAQTLLLPQTPRISGASGLLCAGARHPPPMTSRASAVEMVQPATAVGGTQAAGHGWFPALPPQAPPPASQLTPTVPPGNASAMPQGSSREGGPASTHLEPSQDDSCNPSSVYGNFRRWQQYKPLARMHFRLSPDAEAFSCFLIPVLRSLARRKPTMTLEEGLHRAVQEWRHTSNFNRMIYYEMAGKFMEFEIEELRQIEMLEEGNGSRCSPRPAPPKLDLQVPPGIGEGQRPVSVPKKASPKVQCPRQRPHRHPQTQRMKAPKEIPLEAIKEYIDIMDGLEGPLSSASEKADGKSVEEDQEQQQEEAGLCADPELLSYIDKLCAEEDFVTKVEAVIHPRFLEELLAPGADIDLLALTEELQQEEGLTATQLAEKRLLALKEGDSVKAPSSSDVSRLDSVTSKGKKSHGAERRDDHGFLPGDEIGINAPHCDGRADTSLDIPKDLAVSPRRQEYPDIITTQLPSPSSSPALGRRDEEAHQATSSASSETSRPADRSSGAEYEELPSFTFPCAPGYRLVPWGSFKRPLPASGLHPTRVQGAQRASQNVSSEKSHAPRPAATSPKQAVFDSPSSAENTPHLETDFGVSGQLPSALSFVQNTQPRKRKRDLVGGHRKKKRHCRK